MLLHGFMDTWRVWELTLPALERRCDVLALTLPGHAGGPALDEPLSWTTVPDAVERAMDTAGFDDVHVAGNSLGGYVALQLAERGRARSVTAFAPAGGWASGDPMAAELFGRQAAIHGSLRAPGVQPEAILEKPDGRRRATELITESWEHIPEELIAHQLRGVARAEAGPLLDFAAREEFQLDPAKIDCPVRIAWGTEDRLLPWPDAAARYREEWLPNADWVTMDGVGHCPPLDVPLETAELILGMT